MKIISVKLEELNLLIEKKQAHLHKVKLIHYIFHLCQFLEVY